MKRFGKILCICIGVMLLGTVGYVNAHKPYVALTFDDGPNPQTTQQLLDILDQKKAHATFFLIGQNVEKYPDLAKHIVMSGNAIGNHTWDHKNLTTLSLDDIKMEISKTQDIIYKTTGTVPKMFRPPYGIQNRKVLRAVGLPSMQWSLDTKDRADSSGYDFVQNIVKHARPGDIILMHDRPQVTVDHLGKLIDALRQKGFDIATIPMLFGGVSHLRTMRVYHRE